MSMSVDGLISGMDTTSLINQLLQVEAGQQTQLKTKLSAAQTSASAYRTVNTTFLAVSAAADAVLKSDAWTPAKATSSATSVSASAATGATPGSLTFRVQKLATAHSVINRNTGVWTSADSAYGATEIEIFDKDGAPRTPKLTVGGTGTLADAAAAINGSSFGLRASVVQLGPNEVALQVTAKETGAASKFSFSSPGTFATVSDAQDATLLVGPVGVDIPVTSTTNTFTGLMPGVTLTVSKADPATEVTVTVAEDRDAVAAKIQTLVDAVNSALSTVKTYTNNSKGSTAALKGDYPVTQLAGQLLDAVSYAVGADGSPARVGFELTKDGKIDFDKSKFLTALKDDPALAQRMVAGTAAGAGPDGKVGTSDDIAPTGIAGRLLQVAKRASDSATGSLVKLAEGQDSIGEDIQERIDAWDLRLANRKTQLTRQFAAMETALSGLKNQSTWLAGQINSLPSWSSS
jgi:flagellar hook-associated protein 2